MLLVASQKLSFTSKKGQFQRKQGICIKGHSEAVTCSKRKAKKAGLAMTCPQFASGTHGNECCVVQALVRSEAIWKTLSGLTDPPCGVAAFILAALIVTGAGSLYIRALTCAHVAHLGHFAVAVGGAGIEASAFAGHRITAQSWTAVAVIAAVHAGSFAAYPKQTAAFFGVFLGAGSLAASRGQVATLLRTAILIGETAQILLTYPIHAMADSPFPAALTCGAAFNAASRRVLLAVGQTQALHAELAQRAVVVPFALISKAGAEQADLVDGMAMFSSRTLPVHSTGNASPLHTDQASAAVDVLFALRLN